MNNLVRFLSKNSFVFFFLLLQSISFVLLVKNNNYHHSKIFNSSNFLIGNLYATIDGLTNYLHLREGNIELAEQNAKLQSTNISSFTEVYGDVFEINDIPYSQKYVYTSAKVINNSTNKNANYLTIDKGSLDGIQAGMAVIAPSGVVGKVIRVSKHFSSIMSVLHHKSKVNGKIKETGYFGPVIWSSNTNNYQTGQLIDIPNHVELTIGDTIITSGYSDYFPEGISIGTIRSFKKVKGSNFHRVSINFSVNYQTVSNVFIVRSFLKKEQQDLEALNSKND